MLDIGKKLCNCQKLFFETIFKFRLKNSKICVYFLIEVYKFQVANEIILPVDYSRRVVYSPSLFHFLFFYKKLKQNFNTLPAFDFKFFFPKSLVSLFVLELKLLIMFLCRGFFILLKFFLNEWH